MLPKSSKIRLIIELWRSIALDTPFTLYIFNISHDKKKKYNNYMNTKGKEKKKKEKEDCK
jgi:hypothetical protein